MPRRKRSYIKQQLHARLHLGKKGEGDVRKNESERPPSFVKSLVLGSHEKIRNVLFTPEGMLRMRESAENMSCVKDIDFTVGDHRWQVHLTKKEDSEGKLLPELWFTNLIRSRSTK